MKRFQVFEYSSLFKKQVASFIYKYDLSKFINQYYYTEISFINTKKALLIHIQIRLRSLDTIPNNIFNCIYYSTFKYKFKKLILQYFLK